MDETTAATTTRAATHLEPYEVFRQEREGAAMQHAGNLLAPDPELALHYAREFYGRRQESHRLWVVPRWAILDLANPDLLQPPLDRSFKKPPGYSAEIKRKLAAARARVGAGEVTGTEADDPVVAAGRHGGDSGAASGHQGGDDPGAAAGRQGDEPTLGSGRQGGDR